MAAARGGAPYTRGAGGLAVSKAGEDNLEKKLYALAGELGQLLASERMAEALGELIAGAAKTKASLDRNIDGLLSMANIPTRAEYRRIETKIDSLQASVLSLSRKLERLESSQGSKKKAAKRSTAKPAVKKGRSA